jgi:lipoprotein-releasing system permease protein
LANQLGVFLGDSIQLISPLFSVPTAFGLLPRVQNLHVVAIFTAGMPEYDQSYSFIPLGIAQSMNNYTDAVDYVEIRSSDPSRFKQNLKLLAPQFPQYRLEDWSSFDASLYAAIRFEKYLMFVIMLFMFIIASFNLTGSLLKLISQKKRELGLLKALGYSGKELRRLFLYQGLLLSSIGIISGIILSTLLLLIQDRFGIIRLSLGAADHIVLPVKLMLADYLSVIIVSYILTVLSVLLPLKRLKKINAVELIRRTA